MAAKSRSRRTRQRTWGPDPRAKIPLAAQQELRRRPEAHVRERWSHRCREIAIRFRGRYAYVDAFPVNRCHLPSATPEQRARIEATPTHLCRLGFLEHVGLWEYAFFAYSSEKYLPSVCAWGSFEASPEEALLAAWRGVTSPAATPAPTRFSHPLERPSAPRARE